MGPLSEVARERETELGTYTDGWKPRSSNLVKKLFLGFLSIITLYHTIITLNYGLILTYGSNEEPCLSKLVKTLFYETVYC